MKMNFKDDETCTSLLSRYDRPLSTADLSDYFHTTTFPWYAAYALQTISHGSTTVFQRRTSCLPSIPISHEIFLRFLPW